MRCVGTTVRGIRTPIIKEGDDLATIIIDSVLAAQEEENFTFKDRDIIAMTEAVVSISSGNYASLNDIADDVLLKYPSKHVGLVFPILSRNRFSMILKGIARKMDKITMLLSFPADEVGNGIMDEEKLHNSNYHLGDVISESDYYNFFGDWIHPFTGINMVTYYKQIAHEENCAVEFVFSNDPKTILQYTNDVLACDIHSRKRTVNALKQDNANVYALSDVLNKPINNSGCNPTYGLLGSNKSTEERVKLFPSNGHDLVYKIQARIKEMTGKDIEVMVYGDGAFKDPVGLIWELADPVVSPAYTKGLEGTPNELKLKYVSDNKFTNLSGEQLQNAVKEEIRNKDENLKGQAQSLGTTPRRYTDLIGSLCDLTSGSGDKGTPVVYVSGYFDNYASE